MRDHRHHSQIYDVDVSRSGYPPISVSKYANASQLLVNRGDNIKRGQVIAHAGQTGNVTSPQLHFEIRKGATPVDPIPFLGKAN